MKKLQDLSDLLALELHELYSSEAQQADALANIVSKAGSPELKRILDLHRHNTSEQLSRVKKALNLVNEKTQKENNGIADLLLGRINEVIRKSIDPEVKDTGIIAGLQALLHYEIAGYGTALAFARALEEKEVAELLNRSLDEEKYADRELTKLAVDSLNEKARTPITAL